MTASIQLKFYIFVILYQKLIGMAPYSYNNLKKKFVTNKSELIYPILLFVTYLYIVYVLLWKYSVVISSLTLTVLFYGRLTTILLSWFVHCTHRKSIVRLLNAAFHLNDILNKVSVDEERKIMPILLKAGIVTVVNAGLHFFSISRMLLVFKNADTGEEVGKVATFGITLATFVIQSVISTTFFGTILMAKLYFEKLNCSKYTKSEL